MNSLIITTGSQAGTQFSLGGRPLSVGRDPSRDIQIMDPKVSRRHAMVRRVGGGHLIAAGKALNGVFVNGRRIEDETALREGDEITLGETTLRYAATPHPARGNGLHQRKVADAAAREHLTVM